MKKIHVIGSLEDDSYKLTRLRDEKSVSDNAVNTLMNVLRNMDMRKSDIMIWDADTWDTKVWG